jgi:hypothetical protein
MECAEDFAEAAMDRWSLPFTSRTRTMRLDCIADDRNLVVSDLNTKFSFYFVPALPKLTLKGVDLL